MAKDSLSVLFRIVGIFFFVIKEVAKILDCFVLFLNKWI